MPLKIKVCGLRLPEQVIALDAMGVDYCGIIFFKESSRFAGESNLKEALRNENLKCRLTGIFVNESKDVIAETIRRYRLKAVQLCGTEDQAFCSEMRKQLEVLKVFHLHDDFDFSVLADYEDCCDYFLFDTKSKMHGGSGKKFEWDLLQSVPKSKLFFLSGGISPDDIEKIKSVHHPSLYGIDINSGFEISPGNKNISAIQNFYDQIQQL